MILRQSKANGRNQTAMKLHSAAALLKERHFSGSFDIAGASYRFTYAPSKAEIVEGRLQLQGRLTITDPQGRPRMRDPVKAKLAAIQGGIGGAPPRPSVAGNRKPDPIQSDGLPIIESTGALSFCGVMYFHFQEINGPSLGVAADLSRVQLNARLAPVEAAERDLHGLYSALIERLYGDEADPDTAEKIVAELNRALAAG